VEKDAQEYGLLTRNTLAKCDDSVVVENATDVNGASVNIKK
jgi:hypothetical protein